MNIGIIGSRRRNTIEDFELLAYKILEIMEALDEEVVLVSGGCPKGGDHFAEILSRELDIPIIIHYPDKSKLPENPQRWNFAQINFERNTLIARDSDILVAIVAEDRTGGTEDTIKKFKKMKKGPIFLL